MLNKIWPLFIIVSICYAFCSGNIENLNNSVFESIENVVNFSLTLLGMTCFWTGIMNIVSKTSIINGLSKMLNPILNFLFSDTNIKTNSKKVITMNIIANLLGLGNAATSLGLNAMNELQKENQNKESLSDNMMMLIVLNTASLQIIPTTVLAIRSSLGSKNPNIIIIPVWIATISAAVAGIVATKILIKNRK